MIFKDDYEVFETLDDVTEMVRFVNSIIFSKDEDEELEYLLNLDLEDDFGDEEEDDEDIPENMIIIDDVDDVGIFKNQKENEILALQLYNIINSKEDFFIDLEEFENTTVIILGNLIYHSYETDFHIEDFKRKKLFNNNIIFQTVENIKVPESIKPYLDLEKTKVYEVLGILETPISLS